MSLDRTVRDLVEQVRREERARLAACVRENAARGRSPDDLARRIELAEEDGTFSVTVRCEDCERHNGGLFASGATIPEGATGAACVDCGAMLHRP